MSEGVPDPPLAVPVLIILGGAYFHRSGPEGLVHDLVDIRHKEPDEHGRSAILAGRKECGAGYLMYMKYGSVYGQFSHMYASVVIAEAKMFDRPKGLGVKGNVLYAVPDKKLRGKESRVRGHILDYGELPGTVSWAARQTAVPEGAEVLVRRRRSFQTYGFSPA